MSSTDVAQRSQAHDLVDWVRADERRNQIAVALPEGVSIDRFERATATALLAKPDLVQADRASLYLAILNAAQAGLVPDGRQGAIVVYGGKAQFLPMIGGVRDKLAEYGWQLTTSVVYAADEFSIDVAEGRVRHLQPRPGVERGAIEGAYAQARHRDGRRMAEMMTVAEINYVRDKSARSKNVWNDWWTRMAEKTVGHRIAKKLPLDPKDRARLDVILDALEPGEAAEMLYGPHGTFEASPADPLPAGNGVVDQPGSSTADAGDADVPATESGPAEADGQADDEPGPAPPPVDEAMRALADAAAAFKPASKKWGAEMTLGEIFNHGDDGRDYVKWCVLNAKRPEFVKAAEDLLRVYAPGLYAEAMAEKELKS
jgi:recombination protein RecT